MIRQSLSTALMRVVLLTTAAAVLVAGLAMLTRDLVVIRQSWAADMTNEASVLALATGPALAFDDKRVAQQFLDALSARRSILMAAVYDNDGRLYAAYRASRANQPPARAPGLERTTIHGSRVELVQPIVRGSDVLGTMYLIAQYDIVGRIYAYLGIFGFVMVLSLAVAYVFSRRLQRGIMEPLNSISTVARQLVERRDYSLRVKASSSQEFGFVVDALNNMLREVQSASHAQEEAMRSLQEEVATRKTAESALAQADRRKDEFLATLAHELRNPLAPIRQAIRILERGNAGPERSQWARQVIERQVARMALMLDDLLEVSRITRGALELKKDLVTLDALTNAAIETARPMIDAKRQSLSVHLPARAVSLRVDPLRLSQSISNLLTNASKYTNPEGSIILTVQISPQAVEISVQDNGIGLEAAVIPTLFQMFSQVDAAIDRTEGGLGIGLALVKGFVELHGGTVQAHSEGLGKGSEFVIQLPATVVVEMPTVTAPETREVTMPGTSPRKVLVADDNRDAADSLAALLEMGGITVSIAHSGREAFEKIIAEKPAVAILDIGMADMTGYEIARRVRSAGGNPIYLLAVTGWGQADDVARAKEAGFDEHFTKPVDPDRIEALIRAKVSVGQS
jgi:signal transduction histidine kinase/ActR/RegA family two-component response regulator